MLKNFKKIMEKKCVMNLNNNKLEPQKEKLVEYIYEFSKFQGTKNSSFIYTCIGIFFVAKGIMSIT